MAKLIKTVYPSQPDHEEYSFFCPGCNHSHTYVVKWGAGIKEAHRDFVKSINGNPDACQFPEWQFNGDLENPSFQPSLLNTLPEGSTRPDGTKRARIVCHLYLTNGMIEYCPDCTHPLNGQKVPMKDVE